MVIPNGTAPDAFSGVDDAPLPADVTLHSPVAGMVGRLSPRVDLAMLEAVADDDVSLLLVGPRDDDFEPAGSTGSFPDPTSAGWGQRPFRDLPSYLRVIDVGLTPYADTEFNRSSSPAEGARVPGGRPGLGGIGPAGDPALDRTMVRSPSDPRSSSQPRSVRRCSRPRTPEIVARRRAVARENSWAVPGRPVPGPDPDVHPREVR